MPQIGLRASDELIEAIDADKDPSESRSEYIREAIRSELASDDLEDRITQLEDRVDALEDQGLFDLL